LLATDPAVTLYANVPAEIQSMRASHSRLALQRGVLCLFVLLPASGCASLSRWTSTGWVADYDTAEQLSRAPGSELLIFFKDTRPGADDSVEKALNDEPVKGLINGYVRCRLFKSYEPDRRYVAQYGVRRAPALIVVHEDGTYHARSGTMPATEVAAFLSSSRPPGERPTINPNIPRRPHYDWQRSIDEAEKIAMRTNQEILVVFHRSLSSDWLKLKKFFSRREVHARLADMVHCRIGLMNFLASTHETRFGILRLPALVIVHRDGTHGVLELPTCYEAIIRFADAVRQQTTVGFQSRADSARHSWIASP
jgi:hypothetical protein